MGDLNSLWLKRLRKSEHRIEAVEVLPMHHDVDRESHISLLDERGEFQFMCVRSSAGKLIRLAFICILQAELNVLKACILKGEQPISIESEPRGNHVDVETRGPSGKNERLEVRSG